MLSFESIYPTNRFQTKIKSKIARSIWIEYDVFAFTWGMGSVGRMPNPFSLFEATQSTKSFHIWPSPGVININWIRGSLTFQISVFCVRSSMSIFPFVFSLINSPNTPEFILRYDDGGGGAYIFLYFKSNAMSAVGVGEKDKRKYRKR